MLAVSVGMGVDCTHPLTSAWRTNAFFQEIFPRLFCKILMQNLPLVFSWVVIGCFQLQPLSHHVWTVWKNLHSLCFFAYLFRFSLNLSPVCVSLMPVQQLLYNQNELYCSVSVRIRSFYWWMCYPFPVTGEQFALAYFLIDSCLLRMWHPMGIFEVCGCWLQKGLDHLMYPGPPRSANLDTEGVLHKVKDTALWCRRLFTSVSQSNLYLQWPT